jgi:hypothetical protein
VKETAMPKVVHEETMCCGYKRCPTVKLFDDGSVELSDNDVMSGSTGTIKIRPEAADRLVQILSERKR